ncbi:MAG TPA: hypothetical protein VID71_01585 [Steroidobacteraceae bacterium]
MTPTEEPPDAPASYREAISQLLAAAQRTHDLQAWITLTALAGMFERLDEEHQAHGGTAGPTS